MSQSLAAGRGGGGGGLTPKQLPEFACDMSVERLVVIALSSTLTACLACRYRPPLMRSQVRQPARPLTLHSSIHTCWNVSIIIRRGRAC